MIDAEGAGGASIASRAAATGIGDGYSTLMFASRMTLPQRCSSAVIVSA